MNSLPTDALRADPRGCPSSNVPEEGGPPRDKCLELTLSKGFQCTAMSIAFISRVETNLWIFSIKRFVLSFDWIKIDWVSMLRINSLIHCSFIHPTKMY